MSPRAREAERLAQHSVGATEPVDVGDVEQIDSEIDGPLDRAHAVRVIGRPVVRPSHRRAPERDSGDGRPPRPSPTNSALSLVASDLHGIWRASADRASVDSGNYSNKSPSASL